MIKAKKSVVILNPIFVPLSSSQLTYFQTWPENDIMQSLGCVGFTTLCFQGFQEVWWEGEVDQHIVPGANERRRGSGD